MKITKIIGWVALAATLGTAFMFVYVYATMYIWNWLVPEIFNGPMLSFWQTAGLILLVKLFVGFSKGWGWGGNYKHYMWKQRMKEKFGHMSEEEKQAFKAEMKNRWKHKKWGGNYDYCEEVETPKTEKSETKEA
jgi:hypothetical protein